MSKNNKDLINFNQIALFGAIIISILIFIFEFSHIIGLGLSGGQAFAFAIGYVAPPTIIALVLSFVFNKFKFNNQTFNKFWFWIMIITLISYVANSLVS